MSWLKNWAPPNMLATMPAEYAEQAGDRGHVPIADGHGTLLLRAEPVRGREEARVDRGLESGAVREDRGHRISAAQHQEQRE